MKFIALLLLVAGFVHASEPLEKSAPELEKLFTDGGVSAGTGTFVLYDISANQLRIHNAERGSTRFIPASTYKIPNSLIALQTGAVKDLAEILTYGGTKQPFPQWERDMNLRDAFKVSNVPVYQGVARRIGLDRMRQWIGRLDYGNQEVGTAVDQFWLKGPLKVSAIEQTRFLARLAQGQLPVKPEVLAQVKDISTVETTDVYVLHAKTGWCNSTNPDLGWYVGWIERKDTGNLYAFALNIDMPNPKSDTQKRIPLARACLTALGALPGQ